MTREERLEKNAEVAIRRKFKGQDTFAARLASVYPEGAEREFRRVLKKYQRAVNAILEKCKKEIIAGKPKNAALRRAERAIGKLAKKYDPKPEIGKIAAMVEKSEVRQFKRSVKQTMDVTVTDVGEFEEEKEKWSNEAVVALVLLLLGYGKKVQKLRKSDDLIADVEKLKKQTGDIELFARNQVGDFSSEIVQKIYKNLGVKRYIWRSRRDSRVRECHAWLDGQVFKLSEPPEMWYRTRAGIVYTGRHCHPGQDYNCRCNAIPIFDIEVVERAIKLSGKLR